MDSQRIDNFQTVYSSPAISSGWLVLLCGLFPFVSTAAANPPVPQLTSIFPAGCQVGQDVLVKISGSNLAGLSTMRCSHPGVVFVQQEKDQFQVTVAADTPTGIYDVYAVTSHGISSCRSFFVTGHHLVVEQPATKEGKQPIQSLPLEYVVSGQIGAAGEVDEYRVSLQAGQLAVLECWAERIDSSLRAILELVDEQGERVASSRGFLGLDPVIAYHVPRSGKYRLRIHDLVYGGSSNHFYRLDLTVSPRVLFTQPSVIERGKTTRVTLFGWNLGTGSQGVSRGNGLEEPGETGLPKSSSRFVGYTQREIELKPPAQRIRIGSYREPATVAVAGFLHHLPGVDTPIWISSTDVPVVLDQGRNQAAESAQVLQVPGEVSGQLTVSNERDWYRITARRGEVFHIEGFAERIGSTADLDISVMDQTGKKELAHFRDELLNIGGLRFPSSHLDPAGRWIAPADGDYLIVVRNLIGGLQADPRRTYRLSVRREESEVQLVAIAHQLTSPAAINVQRGGRQLVDILAFRQRGQNESIRVSARNLPSGVSCPDIWLGPGVTRAPLVLFASDGAETTIGKLDLVGHHSLGGVEISRPVQGGTMVRTGLPNGQGRLTDNVPFAVTAPPAPVLVAAAVERTRYQQGSIVDVAIDVQRRGVQPATEVQLTGVGLPPQVNQQRSLIVAGQTKGNISFYLPSTLPPGKYSLVIKAETTALVSEAKDAKPEAVTLFSNAVTFEVYAAPFVLAVDLDAPRKIQRGKVVQVKYTARRQNGFIGKIHTDVAAAGEVIGIRVRGVTFVGQTESGTLQIIANEDAPLGQQPFLRLEGVGTIEDEPVYLGSCFLKLEIVE
jgi:hypothetical protein